MAHVDLDLVSPPRRRVGALTLVRDDLGRVLMVNPTYKEGWQLPGGGVHGDEPLPSAASRELLEETGLVRQPTRVLVVDHIRANADTGAAEGYNIVLDGGVLSPDEQDALAVPPDAAGEIAALALMEPATLAQHTLPYQYRRVHEAVHAAVSGRVLPILSHGHRLT